MTRIGSNGRRLGIAATLLAAGFVCGALAQRPAAAQMGGLGDAAKKAAGEQGGALGAATKLGGAITDMQKDVSELQKNLDTLREIKTSLGG